MFNSPNVIYEFVYRVTHELPNSCTKFRSSAFICRLALHLLANQNGYPTRKSGVASGTTLQKCVKTISNEIYKERTIKEPHCGVIQKLTHESFLC
jgi:hypothetical protein